MSTRRLPKRLIWLTEWTDRGYVIRQARRGGHWKVFDPDGRLAAVASLSSSSPRSRRHTQADLRRHERRRSP